jgi:branched-chain amino acid transport system substrate-binding protein
MSEALADNPANPDACSLRGDLNMDSGIYGIAPRLLAASAAVLLTVTLGACGSKEDQSAGGGGTASSLERVVKIGHAGPLTGPIAHLGKDNENGVRLAIEEANAAGTVIGGERIRFEMISEDDEGKESKSTVVAQKIADAKVAGVIGHLNSGTTIPASKIYHDAGLPQISPSATNVNYTNQGFKTAFRVMANDAQQGKVLGDYAVGKLGAKKIAVIDDRSSYGKGLADEFEAAAKAAGATIVTREFTDVSKTDFTAILTRIKGMNPDLVFYGGMDSQSGPMMKQVKNLGLTSVYLTGDGGQTAQFLTLAGAEGEGAYASSPGVPLASMPGGQAFTERYTKRFNQEIQLYAPYAFDAMNTMLAAMKAADSVDPKVYLPALAAIQYQGVTGNVAFDEKGDIRGGSISLYRVKDGKWSYLETVGGGS